MDRIFLHEEGFQLLIMHATSLSGYHRKWNPLFVFPQNRGNRYNDTNTSMTYPVNRIWPVLKSGKYLQVRRANYFLLELYGPRWLFINKVFLLLLFLLLLIVGVDIIGEVTELPFVHVLQWLAAIFQRLLYLLKCRKLDLLLSPLSGRLWHHLILSFS